MALDSFSKTYQPLPTSDLKESSFPLLGDEEAKIDAIDKRIVSVGRLYLMLARPSVWFIVVLASGIAGFFSGMSLNSAQSELNCIDTTWDSLRHKAISFQTQMFDGHFEDNSEYQGTPNPNLDSKWAEISGLWEFGVSRQVLENANKTQGLVQYPGTNQYMVGIEAFHDFHCLNYIRKYTYMKYYENIDEDMIVEPMEERTTHKDHCIEMLRQKLMCTPDMNIYSYHWLSTVDLPYNDFKTQHRCVNWDKFASWAKHQRYHHGAMHKPEGADVYDPN